MITADSAIGPARSAPNEKPLPRGRGSDNIDALVRIRSRDRQGAVVVQTTQSLALYTS